MSRLNLERGVWSILSSSARRSLAAIASALLIVLIWNTLAEYRLAIYSPLREVMHIAFPIGLVLIAICIIISEWSNGPASDDEIEQVWRIIRGNIGSVKWKTLRDGCLVWAVKAFFLPLNFCALSDLIGRLRGVDHLLLTASWPLFVQLSTAFVYASLLAAIIPGYLFGSRLFGNHVRSVEASWFGWSVTLCCYNPLLDGVFNHWLNFYAFRPHPSWATPWVLETQGSDFLRWGVGGLIICFEAVHWWGESIFGARASNLTNRGIITNGPYRYCKHPVYLVKCLGWFLIWLPPFSGGSPLACFSLTAAWIGVCGVYAMRAWVEERLLSRDPDYVLYALWIDRHGMFQALSRVIPQLSFAWRLRHWTGDRANGIPAQELG